MHLATGFLVALLAVSPAIAVAQTPLTTRPVASGLTRPLFVTAPPGDFGRIFVLQQSGQIRIVKGGILLPTPFLDIGPLVDSAGERGLLGAAFHPDYLANGFFWVDYTDLGGDTVLARYRVDPTHPDLADPASAQVLGKIPQPFSNHKGGWIGFSPVDGHLYVATGDGGSSYDPLGNAQSVHSLLGKMLRLDASLGSAPPFYAAPVTNPFVGFDGLDEIWAIGLRNPWRPSFDRWTGDLWIADVGQDTREEVSFQSAAITFARDYGWPCMEGFLCTPFPGGCVCNDPGLAYPILDYPTHGPEGHCSVTGGYVYRGPAIPDLQGSYFYADFCSGFIASLRYDGAQIVEHVDRTAELDPPGPMSIGSISSFGEDANGEIYVCDIVDGEVFQIVPASIEYPGIHSFGTGTPGCDGPLEMGANMQPNIGSSGFKLTCSNAPAASTGWTFVTDAPDPPGSDPFGLGVVLHVDLLATTQLYSFAMQSNDFGFGQTLVPLPYAPAAVGIEIYVQTIWAFSACAPSPFGLASSNGLAVQFLPP